MLLARLRTTFGKVVLGALYTVALGVWAALALDTMRLTSEAMRPPMIPTPSLSTPTPAPTEPAPTLLPLGGLTATPQAQPVNDQTPPDLTAPAGFHPKTGRYIAAWLPNSFGSVNRASFEQNADILDEISPFWYTTNSYGDLLFGREARDQSLIELARSKNVLVIPTVHNVLTTDPVTPLLSNPQRRARHIRNIVDEVVTYNYDGIDIDYEFLDVSLREEYTIFITELADALHSQGKLLTVAVHAKTCDYCGLGGFQDWVAVGKVVDRLRIMTYDYHWRGGGAGPVAPVYWVQEVGEYARTVVDPAKVVIGVPFYGYNWPSNGGDAVGQTWDMINDIIQTYRLEVNLKESDTRGLVQENWISYNGSEGRRVVWFSTSSGLDAKLKLVQELDLAGIAIWRLGGEDPRSWDVIRTRLVQDPFESQRMLNQVLPEH